MLGIVKKIVKISEVGSIGNIMPFLINTPFCSEVQELVNSLKDFLSGIVQVIKSVSALFLISKSVCLFRGQNNCR